MQRIIKVWDSIILNHKEVKLVGFERKYRLPDDSAAVLRLYLNDSTYTGYVTGNNKDGLIVRLLPAGETYGKIIVDSFNGNEVKLSFSPKNAILDIFDRLIGNASWFYFIVYEYKGKRIRLPAICYLNADYINSPVLFSTLFFENGLN